MITKNAAHVGSIFMIYVGKEYLLKNLGRTPPSAVREEEVRGYFGCNAPKIPPSRAFPRRRRGRSSQHYPKNLRRYGKDNLECFGPGGDHFGRNTRLKFLEVVDKQTD